MKHLLAAIACVIAVTCQSQADWASLFQTDPTIAGGHFVVDLQKCNVLGVTLVEVDIIASELQSNGSTDSRVLETLTIDLAESFFTQLDFGLWTQLVDPFRVHYQARGLSPGGNIIADVQLIGDGYPWPMVCRETCVSNLYAYTLVAYSDGGLAYVDIHDGTLGGNYTYIYVKASNWHNQPGGFKNMFTPSFFGLSRPYWHEMEIRAFVHQTTPAVHELKRFVYPNQIPPPDARDYMGYPLGSVTETVYAVKRGKGPWQGLITPTTSFAAQGLYNCGMGQDVLQELYNGNEAVLNAMSGLEMPLLTCQGSLTSGGGQSWGSGYTGWCPYDYGFQHLNDPIFTDLPVPVAEWVIEILNCENVTHPVVTHEMGRIYGGSGPSNDYVLADVANVVVTHWTGLATEEALAVPVGSIPDPRLWPVRRTVLAPGLYDITVITNDGLHIKRFIALDQSLVLRADFASFTSVNIYPVPVTDRRFAIDIDLGLPTSINLTVVNNMGHHFYSKVLDYDLPGEHKHVVSMTSQWPNGIYHAIFQFPDGSSSSVSFTVSDQ